METICRSVVWKLLAGFDFLVGTCVVFTLLLKVNMATRSLQLYETGRDWLVKKVF
jgi:hypothetical protein